MIPADTETSTPAPGAHQAAAAAAQGLRAGVVDTTLTDRMKAAVERLEALAEEIVAELDRLHGDPNIEEGCDLDEEHDGREPDDENEHILGRSEALDQSRPEFGADDLEPSLGGLQGIDQRRWADDETPWFRHQDLEEQCEDEGGACEDEGAVSDDEWSLGWSAAGNQGPRSENPADHALIWDFAHVGDEHH